MNDQIVQCILSEISRYIGVNLLFKQHLQNLHLQQILWFRNRNHHSFALVQTTHKLFF